MVDSRWCRGILNNQIGTFRSTDVEPVGEDGARLITPRHMRPNKGRLRQQRRPKPKTIEELLHRLGLQVLFSQNNPLEIIPPPPINMTAFRSLSTFAYCIQGCGEGERRDNFPGSRKVKRSLQPSTSQMLMQMKRIRAHPYTTHAEKAYFQPLPPFLNILNVQNLLNPTLPLPCVRTLWMEP